MRTIDADALRDKLQSLAYDDWNQGVITSWANAYNECADIVADMPTVEPQRMRGKWIDGHRMSFDGTFHWYRMCSECDYERDDDNIDMDTNFCPNCGAWMVDPQESEVKK